MSLMCLSLTAMVKCCWKQSQHTEHWQDVRDCICEEVRDVSGDPAQFGLRGTRPLYLTVGEDGQADGALFGQNPPDEFPVVGLPDSLHHVFQGIRGAVLQEQGQSQLTAPPAGKIVNCEQPATNPLKEKRRAVLHVDEDASLLNPYSAEMTYSCRTFLLLVLLYFSVLILKEFLQ